MKKFFFILIGLSFVSCLKKIDEVDSANTNIFDPNYAGEQWWVFEDVYTYTNAFNDQFIRFEIVIPEEKAPTLKPTKIDLAISVNGTAAQYTVANIKSNGDFEGHLDITPTGETNFCLEIGVYVEDEDLTINSFTECKNL